MESAVAAPLYDLVVVGSSAGGIEALVRLMSTLPAGFPAPIVLAQHLDPGHTSRLAEILARRTTLTVRQLEDDLMEPLIAGVVYVPPAGRDVEVTADTVLLRSDSKRHPRPSIDRLFSSAAQTHGERTLAVILTGTGSDGAGGARQVSVAGGTVIIEDPRTAAYPMLPASLAPSVVDLVVDLDRIGPLIHDLLTGVYSVSVAGPRRSDGGDPLEDILSLVHGATGIDFTQYKPGTILRRVQRRLAAVGVLTINDYARYLASDREERNRLAASFLVNVTEFFRDPPFFDYLRETILPELIAYGRAHGNRLRIWSSGCSTGEEPYSLALLIADYLGSELPDFTIHIFATDADPGALRFARAGVFPAATVAAVPDRLKTRYFTQVDGGFAIDRRIRGLVVFGEHDVGKRAPFPDIDLVFCRNVLIYFTPELQRRALQLFAFALRDEGILALGSAETVLALPEYFAPVNPHLRIFRRHGGRVLVTSLPLLSPPRDLLAAPAKTGQQASAQSLSILRPASLPTAIQAQQQGSSSGGTDEDETDPLARSKTLLERLGQQVLALPAGVVMVDRQYDVQVINNAAYDLLDIVHAAHGRDLLHLAERLPTAPFCAAIDAAFQAAPLDRRQVTVTYTMSGGTPRSLQITCIPYYGYAEGATQDEAPAVEAALVLISEVTREFALAASRTPPAGAGAGSAGTGQPRRRTTTKTAEEKSLRPALDQAEATIQELRAAVKGLREAYEQATLRKNALIVQQEESQATSEQMRTVNEELQATNEELETVNEEMDATLEQLTTTNEDLQARALELEEAIMEREAQRQDSERAEARFAAILGAMSDAVLVVDAAGKPILSNDPYDRLLGSDAPPATLEDLDGRPLPAEESPERRARAHLPFDMEFSLVSADGVRRVLHAHGQPVSRQGAVIGEVVVIRDTTVDSARSARERALTRVVNEVYALQATLGLAARVLSGEGMPAQRRAAARAAWGPARRLAAMIREVVPRLSSELTSSRGAIETQIRAVDLAALTTGVVNDFNALYAAVGDTRRIDLTRLPPNDSGPVTIAGDSVRLRQMLFSLLSPVWARAGEGERVDVILEQQADVAELHAPRYFAPQEPAADASADGKFLPEGETAPMGAQPLDVDWSLVVDIVAAHGGSVILHPEREARAWVVLRFALANDQADSMTTTAPRREHDMMGSSAAQDETQSGDMR